MKESTSELPLSALLSSPDEEMNVYLKIVKTVPMKVKRTDTIATLKANINRQEGISEKNQKLFFDGKLLPDALSIVGCGVQNNATLNLISMDYVAVKIFVKKQLGNRVITLETRASETVQNIKLMIQEKAGFHPNNFNLVCNGNLLEDGNILASVGIRNNSIIRLIFRKKEVLIVLVKARDFEALKLPVKSAFTVRDVKAIAMSLIGETFSKDTSISHALSLIGETFCDDMSLYYAGNLLDDSKTVAFYDIQEGDVLTLVSNVMQIFVKTSGKTLTLNVQHHHTMKEIIARTFQKLQGTIPGNAKIGLVYGGKRLLDDKDLASYGIQRQSTLELAYTLD